MGSISETLGEKLRGRWLPVLLFIVGIGAISGLTNWVIRPISREALDQNPPSISVLEQPKALGTAPQTLKLQVSDEQAGLDVVEVYSSQDDVRTLLFRHQYAFRDQKEGTLSLTVPKKKAPLEEGIVELEVTVSDKSFFQNLFRKVINIPVDLEPPRVSPLSIQHNAVRGGVSLVIYDASDDRIVSDTGVDVFGAKYPGRNAGDLDSSLAIRKSMYYSFFPVPFDAPDSRTGIKLYANDDAANTTHTNFYYTLRDGRQRDVNIELDPSFFVDRLDELSMNYKRFALERNGANIDTSNRANLFNQINSDFRSLSEHYLLEIIKDLPPKRQFKKFFLRMKSSPVGRYGERRRYLWNGEPIGRSLHLGEDLASVPNSVVPATADGTVVHAGDLGIYGQTIVLNHGLGIVSVYAHLSSIEVSVNDVVIRGDRIGLTGSSGLSMGDHLHFEIRANGVPVNPLEWWDKRWFRDHIEKKIAKVKNP